MNKNPEITVSEKIKSVILKVLFFFVLILGLYFVYLSFGKGGIYVFLFGVLPCGLVVGILFSVIYLPKIGDSIGNGFLFPRKFLEKAPPVLSPFIGLLNDGYYQRVFDGLQPMLQEYPGNPDVVYLFAQACMKIPGAESIGFSAMEQHFSLKERTASENHIKLLLFYADQAAKLKYTQNLLSIVAQEEKTSYYTEAQKKAIQIRKDSLWRMLNVD